MLNIISLVTALAVLSVNTVVAQSTAAAARTKQKVISIAEARALPLGTRVTIEGSITVPAGAFKSSFNDE
ncbi:MAG TPA: hypothetical protein VF507_04550, partial [Pyrinomonadaceae bacterium]